MSTIPGYTPVYNYCSHGYYEPWQSPEALYEPSTVIINDSWLRPRSALERCTMKTTSFSARRMEKRDNTYWVTERSGREVRGPKLTIQKKIIINPKPDGKFAGIKVMLDFEDEKNIMCYIPYNAFVKRDVLPHLPQKRSGFDCPESYITAAFYKELFANDDFSFLHTPTHSGWEIVSENKAVFNSACNVDPQLASLYPADVCSRVMVGTQKNLADACEALAKVLPSSWKYKFLICARVTSLLLFFYGSTPDMLITIEAPDEDRLRSAMTLLWNKDRMPTALPVASSRSKIERELAGVTDGVVLFSDYSYAEDHRKREAGLGVIFDSLRDIHGYRCLSVLLTEQLGNVSAEAPVIPLNLIGCPRIDDYNVVGDALGELDSAIIKLLSRSPLDDNLVTGHCGKVDYIQSFPSDSKQYKLTEMFLTSMEIMHSYGLVSDDDKASIIKNCFRYSNFFEYDLNFQIVNDFKRVVSECLSIGSLKAISQYGQPYFTHEQNKVIVDSHFLNITRYALETVVIPKLRLTRKRKRLLQALRAAGKLYATNNNKRAIDVETAPGVFSTVNVYSAPLDILSSECTARLRTITHAGNLISPDKAPAGFIPLISINGSDEAAGVVISDLTDEATSVYISGQTRTGKSCFLANQAVLRSRAGHKVVILDQAGSF